MPTYLVISPPASPQLQGLKEAVATHFSEKYYEVAPGQFFVSAPKLTTKQVSGVLDIPGGRVGKAIVILVGNYSGWHNKDLWEWLAAQSASDPSAAPGA